MSKYIKNICENFLRILKHISNYNSFAINDYAVDISEYSFKFPSSVEWRIKWYLFLISTNISIFLYEGAI